MDKKRIIVLDRSYSVKYMNSEVFDTLVVCLSRDRRRQLEKEGLNIIACFEDEFDNLPVSDVPKGYLIHSFDSDRFLCRFDYSKRIVILGKEISFWSRVFDTYHPDCIVNEVVTIEFMEVMAIEAERRGIPYYRWACIPLAPKDVWLKNMPYNSLMGEDYWNAIKEDENDIAEAKKYIEEFRVKQRRPYYVNRKAYSRGQIIIKQLRTVLSYAGIFLGHYSRFFSRRFVYEDYYYLRKSQLSYSICRLFKKKYDSIEFDNNIDYYFYPLHYEPEAAVEYVAYYYSSQMMMVERIAHSLKVGQKLIVKEHPQQRGLLMSKRFQDLKKRYPNLIYLSGNISAYDVYPRVKCLITLNSTAGFEAWVCKRPVIVFGDVFYKDFPGIIKCDSFKSLYTILRSEAFDVADEEAIVKYVAKICHNLQNIYPYFEEGENRERPLKEITKQVESFVSEN